MRRYFPARSLRTLVTSAAAVAVTACSASSLGVTNINQPNLAAANNAATAAQYLITGIVGQERSNFQTWVVTAGAYGREYWLENPNFGQAVIGPLRDWNLSQSVGLWTQYYATLRNVQQLKKFVDTTKSIAITASQKASAKGIADTFQALELLYLIGGRDTLGIPVQVDSSPLVIYPFVTRDSAYKFISAILDSGQVAMQAATSLGFTLPGGYAAVASTPAGFIQFNRALKARVEAYRGSLGCGAACYNTALTALSASFYTGAGTLSTSNLATGVYHSYSPATGDQQNTLTFPTNGNYANTSIRDDGKIANVTSDARYIAKIGPAAARAVDGFPSNIGLIVYGTNNFTAPVPIIRNEELSLLYAEAQYFTGGTAAAFAELNLVHTVSGGNTTPIAAFTSDADFKQKLLNERRLSLLYEGHRWVDTRRLFGNVLMQGTSTATNNGIQWVGLTGGVPQDEPAALKVATSLPIPLQECVNRKSSGNAALVPASCN